MMEREKTSLHDSNMTNFSIKDIDLGCESYLENTWGE